MAALQIRQQRGDDADRQAVRALTLAAFGPGEAVVADLVEALQASDAYAGNSFLAERDGVPVGHVMLTRSWVDAPLRLIDVQVLSPLSVHPDHQRQGIGGRLVAHAVDAADESGVPAVFLEGDPAYYRRLGFERASSRGFSRPSARIPDEACQVRVLRAHEPWMTGALVYCDRFWAFDCVGLR